MFWNDMFEQILDTFCNNNCDSWLLTGGNLTLAVFGRWPIYFMKWGRYCTCCTWCYWVCVCVCVCEWERERKGERERDKQGAGRCDRSFTLELLDVEPYGAWLLGPGWSFSSPPDTCCLSPSLALLASLPLHSSLLIHLSSSSRFNSISLSL